METSEVGKVRAVDFDSPWLFEIVPYKEACRASLDPYLTPKEIRTKIEAEWAARGEVQPWMWMFFCNRAPHSPEESHMCKLYLKSLDINLCALIWGGE